MDIVHPFLLDWKQVRIRTTTDWRIRRIGSIPIEPKRGKMEALPSDLRRKRTAYVAELEEAVNRLVAVLSAMPEVERVILFGSYARGRRDLFTDLDVLVLMRTELGFLERTKYLYRMLDLPVDADILCYLPEEFERLKERPFLRRALQEGIVVYEKKPA
jgi:predicted nucleotidyltransferase